MNWFLPLLLISLLSSSCSTPPREARPHPATYAMDTFYIDEEPRKRERGSSAPFYYKDCELVSRRRFPSQAQYECNDIK